MKLVAPIFTKKVKNILFFLIIVHITPYSLFSMEISRQKDKCLITLDINRDILTIVLGTPDQEKIYNIIAIQKQIHELHDSKIINPPQEPFWQIQKALFPCFALTQTCKTFYNAEFKALIVKISQENLSAIFPQGIALFLLPKPVQISMFDNYFSQYQDQFINNIVDLCYVKSNLASQSDISKDAQAAESFARDNKKITAILNAPNDIIYIKDGFKGSEEYIKSYTIIEYVLHRLSHRIGWMCRISDHYDNLSIQELEELLRNFFIVIDHLCSLDILDLSLPAAQSNRTLAQEIMHQFNKYPYPKTFFSEKSNQRITDSSLLSDVAPARTPEKKEVLNTLIHIYLALGSDETKKTIIQYQEKKLKEKELQETIQKENAAKKHVVAMQKKQFRNNLIKISVVIILGLIATVSILKKFIRNDTHFPSLHSFCKFFYHR